MDHCGTWLHHHTFNARSFRFLFKYVPGTSGGISNSMPKPGNIAFRKKKKAKSGEMSLKDKMAGKFKPNDKDYARTFGITKILSWSTLLLLLGTGIFLSVVISNSARETLLEKQKEFALLLAENLNQQIYRRFTLPTLIGVGYIALREETQYRRMEQVIQWSTHGLHVREIRIYGHDLAISYSTNKDNVGRSDLAGEYVSRALKGDHNFTIISNISAFWAMFTDIKPESVILETVYPLTDERGALGEGQNDPKEKFIMGVLEMSQDITEDYKTVLRFQAVIITTTLVSSLIVTLIMVWLIRRVDRINAIRLAEKEMLERELHQNEKLASMGRMVASVAHEIRNPLGIIRSSAELLLKRSGDKEDMTTRILKAIFDESKRLSQTVTDFLDYARPKQPKREEVNLSRVLDQVLGFLDSECSKFGVKVQREFPEEGMLVTGDKDFLYRAFYNIITNSLQSIHESKADTGSIIVSGFVEDGRLNLIFHDSGPGFDEESRYKLLDPFVTTKDSGTGLGLTIVNNIIKSHEGSIELVNAPEGGAQVRLEFPMRIQ